MFIENREIEVVNKIKYLGVTLSNKGKYTHTLKDNIDKARRAFFLQIKQVKQNHIPLSCHIDLFVKTIDPILLYGAEIWGFEKHGVLEKFRLKCLKSIIRAKGSTPDYMIYGELGILPLECQIKTRMISYWAKLVDGKKSKLSAQLFRLSKTNKQPETVFKWNSFIEKVLNETGFNFLWHTQNQDNITSRLPDIITRIKDQYLQSVRSETTSMKKKLYMNIIEEWKIADFFDQLENNDCFTLLKFRTDNHCLPVETGRYTNVEYKDRICPKCNIEVGDKYHYLFSCHFFANERKKYIPVKYTKNPNMLKYKSLLKSDNTKTLRNLCKMIRIIVKNFN